MKKMMSWDAQKIAQKLGYIRNRIKNLTPVITKAKIIGRTRQSGDQYEEGNNSN